MGKDKRSRQKARQRKLMKQRRKKLGRRSPGALSPLSALKKARRFPIHECRVNSNWREAGMANVLVSRRRPDGLYVVAVCMVDMYCLGVKDAFANPEIDAVEYGRLTEKIDEPIPCELAHQIIYGGIDYAARYGFRPHSDLKRYAVHVLEPRDRIPPNPDLEFGRDGKPLLVASPRDDVSRLRKTLERTAGPGGFHYLIGADGIDVSSLDLPVLDDEEGEDAADEETG